MRSALFRKTARNNIRKNYRFFVPRILAEAGLLACFYIAVTLASDERIGEVNGGAYVTSFMLIGSIILGLLSVILMLYANSFLMKQRKREFGLYNVLGMEKRHVGRILFHENLTCSMISIVLGCILGIVMYKLCSLLICRLLNSEIILGLYYIKAFPIIISVLFFFVLDLVICFIDRISIAKLNPVELLQSRAGGEREPKTKWLLFILGIICLSGGYYLSVSVKNSVAAVGLFFPAVFLVIFGTYFLFTAGSVFVLKALRKNKRYYYNKKHFSTVAGLLYRMKQNAVGLASIAILATGVLVMISTTVSLYSSLNETLIKQYPQQVYLDAHYYTDSDMTERTDIPYEVLEQIAEKAAEKCGLKIMSQESQRYLEVSFRRKGPELLTGQGVNNTAIATSDVVNFEIITQEMYSALGGEKLDLDGNEIAVSSINISEPFPEDHIILDGRRFDIAYTLQYFPIKTTLASAFDTFGLVVADEDALDCIYSVQKEGYGEYASEYTSRIALSFTDIDAYFEADTDLQIEMYDEMRAYVNAQTSGEGFLGAKLDSMAETRDLLVGMYGTFLFLGIILGIVCLFATALIVYYKQISEGYEDRERFQIMKKVGMSSGEVRQSIRTQILLVFFLPLLVSGIHMLFAFPILKKLLQLLMLSSTVLFIHCSLIVYLAFAAVYVIIYTVTARSYYKIIN